MCILDQNLLIDTGQMVPTIEFKTFILPEFVNETLFLKSAPYFISILLAFITIDQVY